MRTTAVQAYMDDFVNAEPGRREQVLRAIPVELRADVYAEIAQDERVSITSCVALTEPFRTFMVDALISYGRNRITFLEPADDPVVMQDSLKTQLTIRTKTALPMRAAILALSLYGPDSDNEHHRGKLREVREVQTVAVEGEPLDDEELRKAVERAKAVETSTPSSQAKSKRKVSSKGALIK